MMLATRAGQAAYVVPVPSNGVYLGIQSSVNLSILEGPAPNGINHTFALHLAYYNWGAIATMLDGSGVFNRTWIWPGISAMDACR